MYKYYYRCMIPEGYMISSIPYADLRSCFERLYHTHTNCHHKAIVKFDSTKGVVVWRKELYLSDIDVLVNGGVMVRQ